MVAHVVALVPPTLSIAGKTGNNVSLSFASQPGVTYFIEATTNLNASSSWQYVSARSGDGTVLNVTDTAATFIAFA